MKAGHYSAVMKPDVEPGDVERPAAGGAQAAVLDRIPAPADMPLGIMMDRANFFREAILFVVDQVRQRRRLRDESLARMDDLGCNVRNRILELPSTFPGTNREVDQLRLSLETEGERLELERGREASGFWKDVAQIQFDLVKLCGEYRTLIEKIEILTGRPFERPSIQELLRYAHEDMPTAATPPPAPPTELQLRQLRRVP